MVFVNLQKLTLAITSLLVPIITFGGSPINVNAPPMLA